MIMMAMMIHTCLYIISLRTPASYRFAKNDSLTSPGIEGSCGFAS
jgi:hypothetical protein